MLQNVSKSIREAICIQKFFFHGGWRPMPYKNSNKNWELLRNANPRIMSNGQIRHEITIVLNTFGPFWQQDFDMVK